jgi:hypothetical protein
MTMDEWMQLMSSEATYRQREQRDMRRDAASQAGMGGGQRVRTTLAAALVALAARFDRTRVLPRREDAQATPANPA